MKSMHVRLAESIDKMSKAQRDKYYESKPKGATVETLVNCAEAVLAGKVKESGAAPKHNGRSDNGGELFTESTTNTPITEQAFAKGDELLMTALGIGLDDQRRLRGLPPASAGNLSAAQLREYRFLRSIRLSESDSVKGALKVS